MFNRKKHPIVPYPNALPTTNNNNKIKSAAVSAANLKGPISTDVDALSQMRDNTMLSNFEFMQLDLLRSILLKLNSIDVTCKDTNKNAQFSSAYLINKFKWL